MRILGSHILEGMGITLKHFVDSYVQDFKRWRGRTGNEPTEFRQPLDFLEKLRCGRSVRGSRNALSFALRVAIALDAQGADGALGQ